MANTARMLLLAVSIAVTVTISSTSPLALLPRISSFSPTNMLVTDGATITH